MLILVGKSCAGKNTIRDILVEKFGMEPAITYTTRPMRHGEENYVDYVFVSDKHFKGLKQDGFFAETTEYNVATGDTWYYGSDKAEYRDSENRVVILNPYGLKQVRKMGIDVFAVYLNADDKTIMKRQKKRGGDINEIKRRMRADKCDFAYIENYVDGIFVSAGDPYKLAENIYECYRYYLGDKHVENRFTYN